MIETNVKKEQQQLHSLLPLGEGGRRPDEGLKETVRCNSDEMLKQVQHDGSGFVKDAQSQCPPLETLPNKNNPVDCLCERKPEFLIPRRGTKNYDETSHKATEPASCKSLVPQCLSALVTSKKAAFTLAEVLITLAVIGVVAVLTIPGLVKNHNEKAWSTAQDVFTKRLEVATRQMNTEEKLAGYDSTMDFVNELKKYIKITRVCDNSEITKCFDKQVIWNEGDEPVDMSAIKNAQSFGLDWESDTVAVQFANGVNAVIAYNPNATQDPFNNQFSATSNSMAILYDVSGNKNPNTNGKDIGEINVEQLAGVTGCMIPELADTMCITQILAPGTGYSALSKAECEQIADEGYGNNKAYCGGYTSDYWAGAVKACGGIQNMPTQAQLEQLAAYIYPTADSISSSGTTNANWDADRASLFIAQTPSSSPGVFVWSGRETSKTIAYLRYFDPTRTNWYGHGRYGSSFLAVCLSN